MDTWTAVTAMAAGGALGYLWHRAVGCGSGACPIVRSPYLSTIYGILMGLVLSANAR